MFAVLFKIFNIAKTASKPACRLVSNNKLLIFFFVCWNWFSKLQF